MSSKYYTNRQTFINEATGEKVSGMMKIESIDRNNFDIVYIMQFCDIFDALGGQKYKILKWLLQNRNSENLVLFTQQELASELGCSRQTVSETLKILKRCGIITSRLGAIRFNPQVLVHGSKNKENWIFTKFVEEQNKESKSIKQGDLSDIIKSLEPEKID